MPSDRGDNFLPQSGQGGRLQNIGEDTQAHGLGHMINGVVAGYHHERHARPALARNLEQLDAADFGHVPIGYDQIDGRIIFHHFDGLLAIGGNNDGLEAKLAQGRLGDLQLERVVLHQENPHVLEIDTEMIEKCHSPIPAWSALPVSYSLDVYPQHCRRNTRIYHLSF